MNTKLRVLRMTLFAISCLTSAVVHASPVEIGFNPMTGKLLSEEDLNRSLILARLQTQIEQERLKQVQTKGEIALAPTRLDAERGKINALSTPLGMGLPQPLPQPQPQLMPQAAALGQGLASQIKSVPQSQDVTAGPAAQPRGPVQGGIEFAGVRTMASQGFAGVAARVEYVDLHARGAGPVGVVPIPARGQGNSAGPIVPIIR